MEIVVIMPAAVTRWEALPVPVNQDTPEMDLPVQVSQLKHFVYTP